MKRIVLAALTAVSLFSLLPMATNAQGLRFFAPNSQAIVITANEIETQLGLQEGSLYGVTVLAVPPATEGRLYSEGVEVAAYDYLDRAALSSCVFLLHGEEAATRMALLPNAPGGSYTPTALMTSDNPLSTMTATVAAEQYAWVLADQFYYGAITVFAPLSP